MNKQEIDDMMKDLPSQQLPEETALQKFTIAVLFILFLIIWMWVPNFFLTEEECEQQSPQAITIGLCPGSKAK